MHDNRLREAPFSRLMPSFLAQNGPFEEETECPARSPASCGPRVAHRASLPTPSRFCVSVEARSRSPVVEPRRCLCRLRSLLRPVMSCRLRPSFSPRNGRFGHKMGLGFEVRCRDVRYLQRSDPRVSAAPHPVSGVEKSSDAPRSRGRSAPVDPQRRPVPTQFPPPGPESRPLEGILGLLGEAPPAWRSISGRCPPPNHTGGEVVRNAG